MACKLIVIEKHMRKGTLNGLHLLPHSNIAFHRSQGTCKLSHPEKTTEDYSTIYSLDQNLSQFFCQHRSEETLKTVLLQLAHAVHHLHTHGWVHKQIELKNIYVSNSNRKVVLCHPEEICRAAETSEPREYREDITSLRNIFNTILKMAKTEDKFHSYDEELVNNLLEVMDQAETTTTQILQHPFFWDEDKKLNFLSQIAQFTKSDRGNQIKKRIFQISTDVFGDDGWKTQLKITDLQEKREYKNQLQKRKGLPSGNPPKKKKKKVSVGQNVIRNFAEEMNKSTSGPMYRDVDLQSLVNFIRNRREHFWESSLESQACFYFNHTRGFWQFFRRRYPKLLTAVYNVVKTEQRAWNHPGIKDVYFDTLAQNEELPKL